MHIEKEGIVSDTQITSGLHLTQMNRTEKYWHDISSALLIILFDALSSREFLKVFYVNVF